jgi:serine/threonine-protein kinase
VTTSEPERWRRIETLFHQAEALSATRRADFLARACGDDPELRREVESLLAADGGVGRALDEAIARAAGSAVGDPILPRIGAWEVLREIGRGGMGTVYLARRADRAFEQQVAIKVIRGGVADRAQIDRFRAERQILANLDHPAIARLLDGGATDDGLPYLVMEYLEGEPIDRWCDQRCLPIAARLELFLRVCDAVQYAHQNLVVHRDIKPSNILVTAHGAPKLLDFGIAKLLDPAGGQSLALTGSLDRLLTPDFASPEQVRGTPVTTRTDVYALGLLLYLLLTGQPPYRFRSTRPQEIERVVCEQPPTAPSAALLATADGETTVPPAAARARGEVTARLARRLRGDLDNIVLKALAKEPERRYAAVGELMEDVRRHLEGRPIRARPATLGYRLSRLASRHRTAFASAAAVLVLVTVLIALYITGVRRERDRARVEAAKAAQIAGFLTSLFEVSDPGESKGQEVTARELLERGAERIDAELEGQPQVQAALMDVIGKVSRKVGLYDQARRQLERSLEIRTALHGPSHPEVAAGLDDLATLLHETGDYGRAEALFRQSLTMRVALFGDRHADVVASLNNLGSLLQDRGRFEEAEALYRRALALAGRLPDAANRDDSSLLNNLGRVLQERGDLEGAEVFLRRALEQRRKLHGDLHPAVESSLASLATLARARGRYAESEALDREALSISQKLYRPPHLRIAMRLNNLSALLKEMGEVAEAERLQRQALAMFRGLYGDRDPRVAMGLNNLANLLHDRGAFAEAKAMHEEALAVNLEIHGEEHPNVAGSYNNLAVLLKDMGDYDAAEPLQRKALALDRALLGDDHPYVAGDLDSLAGLLLERGEPEAALPSAEESLRVKRRQLGDQHADTALTVALIGRILLASGRAAEAEPLLRDALAIRRGALPEGHWEIAASESHLGACLTALGRYDQAEPLLRAGYEVLRARGGRHARDGEEARERLVALYRAWGKPEQAARFRAAPAAASR